MKLSTRSRYAVRLLLDLAQNGHNGPVSMSDISRRQRIPLKFLEKLVTPLKKAGLVVSKRGPKGGHNLAVEPEKISVGLVARIMETKVGLVHCESGGSICKFADNCSARGVWQTAERLMMDYLDSVDFRTLADGREMPLCPDIRHKKTPAR